MVSVDDSHCSVLPYSLCFSYTSELTKYPPQVRKMIYTTNSIENLNRQIRKVIKTKLSFKSEDNLLNLIYMVIKDFEANHWEKYPIYQYKWWPNFTHKS